jgi:large subunit ribosomal protein L13
MKTIRVNPSEITRKWVLVDAKGEVLGRVASKIASILQGKNNVHFTADSDMGDHVVVVNAAEIVLTGKKADTKTYFRHSTYAGGGKMPGFKEVMAKDGTFPLIHAVKGMLPKNALGRKMVKKLHVYAGAEHPHSAQKPQ